MERSRADLDGCRQPVPPVHLSCDFTSDAIPLAESTARVALERSDCIVRKPRPNIPRETSRADLLVGFLLPLDPLRLATLGMRVDVVWATTQIPGL